MAVTKLSRVFHFAEKLLVDGCRRRNSRFNVGIHCMLSERLLSVGTLHNRRTCLENFNANGSRPNGKQYALTHKALEVIKRLAAVLDYPIDDVQDICRQRPIRLTNQQLDLLEDVKTNHEMFTSVLQENLWILEMASNSQLQKLRERLKYLARNQFSPGSLFVIKTGLNHKKEDVYMVQRAVNEQVDFLRGALQGTQSDILEMFFKDPTLVRVDVKRLTHVIAILLENGIAPQYIKSDPWALHRTPESMLKRLEIAHSVNLPTIKPWILRCKQEYFDYAVDRQRETNAILGEHHNITEYLATRLGISVHMVTETMMARLPMLLNMRAVKMQTILNVLLNNMSVKPSDIQQYPFVLGYRVQTLSERHLKLVKAGCWPISLPNLCQNTKCFEHMLVKLSSNKRREQSSLAQIVSSKVAQVSNSL